MLELVYAEIKFVHPSLTFLNLHLLLKVSGKIEDQVIVDRDKRIWEYS